MAKYTVTECFYCHVRLPKPEMLSDKVKVNTGHSGMGFSFNPAREKSMRISSGRNYYRTKQIWYCKDCEAKHREEHYSWGLFGWLLALPFKLPYWLIKYTYFVPLKFLLWTTPRYIFRLIKKPKNTNDTKELSAGKTDE
tara:strand:+ start:118 stop:534 length:417 start_codon:yes stop_codon:yes gene_type:complete